MILQSYLFRSFKSVVFKISASLILLSVTHALLYAFKKMEGIEIPLDFFILFFMKDVFRSLPFILNFSFALAIGVWQHSLKMSKHDIAALVGGYKAKGYHSIYIFFLLAVISVNALSLFFVYPSMNYTIETELYPKILHNTMLALPAQKAYKIDDNNIFYFEAAVDQKDKSTRLYKGIKILNFDSDQKPILISSKTGTFSRDKNTLFLSDGLMKRVSNEGVETSSMHFNLLEYSILPESFEVSYQSLSLRQLLTEQEPIIQAHLFWKMYLSVIPLFIVIVLHNHIINIKFSGAFNLELGVVTSYYLMIIITGLLATKFIENTQVLMLGFSGLIFITISYLLRILYLHVTK